MKIHSIVLKICDWVTRYAIYAAVFLTPLLFLPWTSDVLDFNKQTVLIGLGFVALLAWMIKVLVSGKIEFNKSPIHIVVGVFIFIYSLATIFSTYKAGSFWGWPQVTAESLLSLLAVALLYFLVSNVLSKRNIFTAIIVLSFSVILTELVGVSQLFGWFSLPILSNNGLMNTIGSVTGLGFFAAILLPLFIILLIVSKKWQRLLFGFGIITSGLILLLVNYSPVWWVAIFGSALILLFGLLKRNLFDSRWMILPTFFLAIALVFSLSGSQVPFRVQKSAEYFLTQSANLKIDIQALKERPILGSGPGTFAYDFSKFKGIDFNTGNLSGIGFTGGASKILNDLATTGVLGFLAFLALMICPISYGIKYLIVEKENKEHWHLAFGLLAGFVALSFMYFLFNSSIVLDFVFFFLISGFIGLTVVEKKEYNLKQSSLLALIIAFVFTLVFIFGAWLVILDGQRYLAEVNYANGVTSFKAGQNDAGTKSMETAVGQNISSDLYLRQLSLIYLAKLQNEMRAVTGTPNTDQLSQVQTLFRDSFNASQMAINLNPNNYNNWATHGYVCQSMIGVIGNTGDCAKASYEQALKLNPNNPYLLTSLGLVYDVQGQKDKAITVFNLVKQLNPDDKTIQPILDNLNAGRSALQSATPPPVTPPKTTPLKNK